MNLQFQKESFIRNSAEKRSELVSWTLQHSEKQDLNWIHFETTSKTHREYL